MALLMLEAFGAAQTTAELLRRFPGPATALAGTAWFRGRQGGRAWGAGPGVEGELESAAFPAAQELIVGAVIRARHLSSPSGVFKHLFSFRNGTGNPNALCRVAWGPADHVDGAHDIGIELRRGSQAGDSTNILIDRPFRTFLGDRWYAIEARVNVVTGTYEIRVNTRTVLEGVGLLDHIGAGQISRISLGFRTALSPAFCWIDSFYVIDPTLPGLNDFLGNAISATRLPAADGSLNEWVPSAGTDHYAMVDESNERDDDVTYLLGAGEAIEERFKKNALNRLRGGIIAAQHQIDARLEGAGSKLLQAVVARDGSSVAEASQDVTTANYNLFRFGDIDPITVAAWRQHHFDDSEIGFRTP